MTVPRPAGPDPLDVDGPAAPPRTNGEVVFTASWQLRLFAATVHLRDEGLLEWEHFRQRLIAEIAAHEQELAEPEAFDYWGCWQRALEGLLGETGLIVAAELDATSQAVAGRPPDHG